MPGPKSVAIETPEQWQPVIRRCVMSERQNLLESFGRLLNPIDAAPAVVEASLKEWHDSVRKKFESGL
jgi:hypothetical protein